jgi:hypothetical protein
MQHKTTSRALSKPTAVQPPDPRFAALARLLARDLARKHAKEDSRKNELSASPQDAYAADSSREDQS